jgi:DNA-binding transcriptional MerR regulator
MARQHSYRVKEVAQITGISVRALHHYDEIGLLVPKARSGAGYRMYDDEDLLRLQQILIGRELGLALEEIRRSLDDPEFDRKRALLAQRTQLRERARKTRAMLRAVDAALAALDNDEGRNPDMKRIFDGFEPEDYERETEGRYGGTDSYRESVRRAKTYTPDDWRQMQAEQAEIYDALAAAQRAGAEPSSAAVLDIAERHRLSIDRWFYPCSTEQHSALADLYETDPRFAENIDKHGAGLTPFLVAAIRSNRTTQRT